MNGAQFPWRQPRELEKLLAEVKPVLASLGVVEAGPGCSEGDIAAAELRSRRFPEDVRAFYRSMRPTELFAPGTRPARRDDKGRRITRRWSGRAGKLFANVGRRGAGRSTAAGLAGRE